MGPLERLLSTPAHYALLKAYGGNRQPDFVIAPDGNPYILRWYLVPRNETGNIYLHVQVARDPERPLHDHPWANTSIILANGYDEIVPGSHATGQMETPRVCRTTHTFRRRQGDVVHRTPEQAHRIVLRPEDPYSISLFVTGPKTREWGFWTTGQGGNPIWVDHREVIQVRDGRSIYVGPQA